VGNTAKNKAWVSKILGYWITNQKVRASQSGVWASQKWYGI